MKQEKEKKEKEPKEKEVKAVKDEAVNGTKRDNLISFSLMT